MLRIWNDRRGMIARLGVCLIVAMLSGLSESQEALATSFVDASVGAFAQDRADPVTYGSFHSVDTGQLPQSSTSQLASAFYSNTSVNPSTGFANAYGTATLGLLHGFVSAVTTGGALTAPVTLPAAEGDGLFTFEDTLTVTSTTLSVGTPVDLLFTSVLNVAITFPGLLIPASGLPLNGKNYALSQASLGSAYSQLGFGTDTSAFLGEVLCNGAVFGPCSASDSQIVHTNVGATLDLVASLTLEAAVQNFCVGITCPPFNDPTAFQIIDLSGVAVNALDTASFFVDPINLA